MTRRSLMFGLGGTLLLGGVAVAGSAMICNWRTAEVGDAAGRLRVVLPDIIEPQRLAIWWRARNAPPTLGDLVAMPGVDVALQLDCPTSRRRLVQSHVREEFRSGQIVIADKMVVSRTECLIAAICVDESVIT